MRAYARWLPDDCRILVLVDRDNDDCTTLKQQLEQVATAAGLPTRASAQTADKIRVYNRIVVEELEAWFFGDPAAIARAYPGVSPNLGKQAKYRIPDAIKGGTWEALERILQRAGYYESGLAKIEAARQIAEQMDPDRNASQSFRLFRDTLKGLCPPESTELPAT
jgi:hypothetical protein